MNKPDQEGFLKLIEQNKGIIFKICHSYCRNKADREDLAQEIIYQLWRSGQQFNADYKFSTWMYRVALNTAITHYRKDKKNSHVVSMEEDVPDIAESSPMASGGEQSLAQLQQFISELKELDKALMLLYLEEKSYAEIAAIIGISVTNVATRISRIKATLKKNFSAIQQ